MVPVAYCLVPPIAGTAKLNTDGSANINNSACDFRGIIRDSRASWLGGFFGRLDRCSCLETELHAMFVGLEILKSRQIKNAILESDSLVACNLIRKDTDFFHMLASLVEDVKTLCRVTNTSVQHSLRVGNQCADLLAKNGASQESPFVFLVEPIPELIPLLAADEAETTFTRL